MPSYREELLAELDRDWPDFWEQIVADAVAQGLPESDILKLESQQLEVTKKIIHTTVDACVQSFGKAADILEGVIEQHTFDPLKPDAFTFTPRIRYILEETADTIRSVAGE